MNTRAICFTVLSIIAISITASLPAKAQRARVFVSVNGNDDNPCTAVSPCRTFQHAHDAVLAGGEISVLDTGGYGTVFISKAISIISPDGIEAGVLVPPGQIGIQIQAGLGDAINLRGLIIDGAGSGLDGILYDAGRYLTIQKCVFRNLTDAGIFLQPIAGLNLAVSDTLIANNTNNGINLIPLLTAGFVSATFSHVELDNNGNGIWVNGNNSSNGTINATVTDSVVTGSIGDGLLVTALNSPTSLMVFRSVVANNNIGISASSTGSTHATLRIGQSTVTGNTFGWEAVTTGIVQSYGDNKIDGNVEDQGPPPTILNK
jgi:hypothetical protein